MLRRGRGSIRPIVAAQAVHDSTAQGQADAAAGVLRAVQAFEGNENFLVIIGVDADAVIGHREDAFTGGADGRDGDARRSGP